MKRLPVAVWVLAPVATGVVACAIHTAMHRGSMSSRSGTELRPDPSVEWTRVIDFGERQLGASVVGKVHVENRGGRELVIDRPSSSCVCAGLEQVRDGEYRPLESLRLAPGEAADLALRMQVKGFPGTTFRTSVSFRSNDPAAPQPSVDVVISRIRGGVSTVPTVATFAPVPVGTRNVQVLDIRDGAKSPRSVQRVASASPAIEARLLPTPAEPEAEVHPAGTLVGRVEVAVRPQSVGSYNGTILLYTDGEAMPLTVPVTGRATLSVEASPSSFVFPRSSGDGPQYSGVCLCRGVEGKRLTLAVVSIPEGISAHIPTANGAGPCPVRISWDPVAGQSLVGRGPVPVRLTATVGERTEGVVVQVVCSGEDTK